MTEKQADGFRLKIKSVKAALAADKRRWGGFYNDSRGLRYLPTQYFIKLGDFDGGLKYLRWFRKNFPDDSGFPDFLFEWTIILFKTGDLKLAEKKAFEVYRRNTYIFDKYFNRPILPIDKYENSNIAIPAYTDYFNYSFKQPDLADFSDWLDNIGRSAIFVAACQKYIDIYKQLKTESDPEARQYLVQSANQLDVNF